MLSEGKLEELEKVAREAAGRGYADHLAIRGSVLFALISELRALRAERDDLLDRVEELECDAEIGSVEFEKDCWVALRSLLQRVGWTDFSEGVTADAACEIIGEAIDTALRAQAPAELLHAAQHAAEAFSTALEWFGQREAKRPTTNGEAAIFARCSQAADYVDAALGLSSPAQAPAPVGGEVVVELLREVQQACLYAEDDGTIGVTSEPTIHGDLFDRICAALSRSY